MNAPAKAAKKTKEVTLNGQVLALEELEVVERDPTRRIVKVEFLENDLVIHIPKTAEIYVDNALQLYKEGALFGPLNVVTQEDHDDPTPYYTIYYPKVDFPPEGTDTLVDLDYSSYDPSSGDGEPSGLVVTIRFDRRAPGGIRPGPIAFTPEQLSGITEGDLVDGELPVQVNPYFGAEPEDTIQMWLGTDDNEAAGTWLDPIFEVGNAGLPTPVSFTRDALTDIGDGTRYFAYRVTDWAGNESVISSFTPVSVFLDVPTLLAPLVPEADDGLITYNDATPDVSVDIPAYLGAADGDRITVSWGGQAVDYYDLKPGDLGQDPLTRIPVPYATVKTVGDGAVVVNYTMRRGLQPIVDSGNTTVQVNLETPGGGDPDPDLPDHPNIRVPLLKVGVSPDNTITPDDFTNRRNGRYTIYRGGVNNSPIWQVGDRIQLYLNQTTDETPLLPFVDVVPGNEAGDISDDVPFVGVIENLPSGQVDMFFTLTRTLLVGTPPDPDVTVTVRSPIQIVNILAGSDLPGGGIELAEAGFPDADAETPFRNRITRAQALAGTSFRINLSGVSNIEIDKEPMVSYDFVGVVGVAPPFTTPPTLPVPPTPPVTVIEASRIKRDDIRLTQEDLTRGYFEVPLTYAQIAVICRNGATVNYSLRNRNGSTAAAQRYVYIFANLGGGACPLP